MTNFSLPEDDKEYLDNKALKYELLTESLPNNMERHGVLFPSFEFTGNLFVTEDSQLTQCRTCQLLILIPDGYATTKLDSFYTNPRLKRADGLEPDRATAENEFFGRKWQFWSRHLQDGEWRPGVDGLNTFILYVLRELKTA